MFFLLDMTHTIILHPSFFGPRIREYLKTKLLSDVEGKCDGQYGYIICVVESGDLDIGRGKIMTGRGSAEFVVKYRAIVWKPFKVRFALCFGCKPLFPFCLFPFCLSPDTDAGYRARWWMLSFRRSTRWASLRTRARCPSLSRVMSGDLCSHRTSG